MREFTNEELVEKVKKGNEVAIEILFARFKALLNKISRSFFLLGGDNEDVMQEAMLGLYKACLNYKGGGETSFKTFAILCIKRNILSAIKKNNTMKNKILNESISLSKIFFNEEEDVTISCDILYPDEKIIENESYEEVKKLICSKLSHLELKILNQFLMGLSYDEMSKKLDVTKKSIDNALRRIKVKLQFLLHRKIK